MNISLMRLLAPVTATIIEVLGKARRLLDAERGEIGEVLGVFLFIFFLIVFVIVLYVVNKTRLPLG